MEANSFNDNNKLTKNQNELTKRFTYFDDAPKIWQQNNWSTLITVSVYLGYAMAQHLIVTT